MVQLGELMMILDLHRQGLSVTAIARRTGRDPKTIRKYIERGLELPAYGPRQVGRPNKITPYLDYLRERVAAFPELTATRLTRELRERGYGGAYTAVKRFVAAIRPSDGPKPFEVRFETPSGHQAQVDFARFVTVFEDEPGVTRIIWLFSMVLGHSRHIVARFVLHQDLQTLLRCHMAAFAAIGGVPIDRPYPPLQDRPRRPARNGAGPLRTHFWCEPKVIHVTHVWGCSRAGTWIYDLLRRRLVLGKSANVATPVFTHLFERPGSRGADRSRLPTFGLSQRR